MPEVGKKTTMPETHEVANRSRQLSPLPQVAAGYINPLRSFDEDADHRRMTDGVLHWQCRPKVYPFREVKNNEPETGNSEHRDISLYKSEFFEKPMAMRKFRPSSINRRNNPHPNAAFHVKHMLNQGVPVVRTRMTWEEFYRRPIDSPYISNTHRVYRKYDPKEIDRVKPLKQISESISGIVPELKKNDDKSDSMDDTKLFPVIPRNTRLTADRAQGIANAGIKLRKNKYQPHLSGAGSSISGSSFLRPEAAETKPSLKSRSGYPDSIASASWDGAPKESARTTFSVFGKKKADKSKIETAAQAVVPELSPPTSKSLMFKEYSQYPKYAPQMLQEYYSGRSKKHIARPYVY